MQHDGAEKLVRAALDRVIDDVELITFETELEDILDSLELLDLAMSVETAGDCIVPDEDLAEWKTLQDVVDWVVENVEDRR